MTTINDMQRIAAEMNAANRIQKELHGASIAQEMQAKRMQEAISRLGAASQMQEAIAALDIGRQMREAMKGFELSEQLRTTVTASDIIGQRMRDRVREFDLRARMHDVMKGFELSEQVRSALTTSDIIGDRIREISRGFDISEDMRRAMASLDIGNQFRDAMKGFDLSAHMQGSIAALEITKKIQEALAGFDATKQIREAMVNQASVVQILAERARIDNVLNAVSPENWPIIYEDEVKGAISQTELQQALTTIVERVTSDSVGRIEIQLGRLIEEVKKLKDPWIQKVLAWIIFPLIMVMISVLLSAYVQQYFDRNHTNDKRTLKKAITTEVVAKIGKDHLTDYRFVVAKTLNVRTKASSKSVIVGTLYFGQVVQLIERDDSWSRVRWTDGSDNEAAVLEGWVFSRYLEKFR